MISCCAYPSGLVFATCDEVCPIGSQLKVGHEVHVRAFIVQDFVACLRIEEGNFSGLVASDNEGRRREGANDSLAAGW